MVPTGALPDHALGEGTTRRSLVVAARGRAPSRRVEARDRSTPRGPISIPAVAIWSSYVPHRPEPLLGSRTKGWVMMRSFPHAPVPARLVVLSDRRPPPGAQRTGVELTIAQALREHDGLWLAHHVEPDSWSGEGDAGFHNDDWSVFAVVPAQPRSTSGEWTDYVRRNAAYAEQIIETVSPSGAVWINGHRWLLVATALRRYGHRGPIGLLLDVPFPSHRHLEALPWYAELIPALYQLDLVGFRTLECAGNFEACAVESRCRPWLGVFSNGVETTACNNLTKATGFLPILLSAARELRKGILA
jgi:hypothetical protein